MSDTLILGENTNKPIPQNSFKNNSYISSIPSYNSLETNLEEASTLVDDIILKKYLHRLTDLEVFPLDDSLKKISDIRIFKITEMVYQNNEYSTYKFASVFNAVQNLNCSVFIIADSDGQKTNFYMGVRSFDNERTTKSLKDTLCNALIGQFPGVQTQNLLDPEAEKFLSHIATKNIASVSCVAQNKDENFNDNETFIQGLEKLVLAMQGQVYTAIILAKSTSMIELEEIRKSYETVYTQLSPFMNMQLSYGTNTALSISNALSHGTTTGKSYSESESTSVQTGKTYSRSYSENNSVSKTNNMGKIIGNATLGLASLLTAPLTGGLSIATSAAIALGQIAVNTSNSKTDTKGNSISNSKNYSESNTITNGETYGTSESKTESATKSHGFTSGTSNNIQLTMKNKTIIDILEKIEFQLKRINECESIGMWECAAYFLSDTQETVEMAAGTYKSLMKGKNSGVETSSINFWGRQNLDKISILRDYITNFIHPVFRYSTKTASAFVTASSLVSSNELAIQMGLPRKSICGFPVINHADFGKEIVKYNSNIHNKNFSFGKVFNMGKETNIKIELDCNSLTMHTFITGSTGSGKSNAVYHILSEIQKNNIPFLVIEPAKGEYKKVFNNDVNVFGTNPTIGNMLCINPFSFSNGIHILEHIDRLVEIFNVCWPMYAAMPAVLKDAIERAYIVSGWDLDLSINTKINSELGELFPTFDDVLYELNNVIKSSAYSEETKSDYIGSLSTRLKSLTNGINGRIFSGNEIDLDIIFNKNTIIDISRIGSMETKSLIMGIIILKLQEFRLANANEMNTNLRHITVLEEAHNLLKKTSTEQNQESSNIMGKSVEMLTNAISEIRTYGEGFIIVDQAPNLLDTAVIRNTNTKIIFRLPDSNDRKITGGSIALNDAQINELSKIPTGVAAIYQNDWQEAVLCKLPQYKLEYNISNISKKHDFSNKLDYDEILHGLLLNYYEPLKLKQLKSKILKMNVSAKIRRDLICNIENKNLDFEWAAADFIYKCFHYDNIFNGTKDGQWNNMEDLSKIMIENIKDVFKNFSDIEMKKILYYICRTQHELYPDNKIIEKLRVEYLKKDLI